MSFIRKHHIDIGFSFVFFSPFFFCLYIVPVSAFKYILRFHLACRDLASLSSWKLRQTYSMMIGNQFFLSLHASVKTMKTPTNEIESIRYRMQNSSCAPAHSVAFVCIEDRSEKQAITYIYIYK